MPLELNPGDLLATYNVVGLLGAGGTGEVYRVRKQGADRVAKVFLEPRPADVTLVPERVNEFRFFQTALQGRLNNVPFAGRLYDLTEERGHFVRIGEFITGGAISNRLRGASVTDRWNLSISLAEALSQCHQAGIANLDLKPDNLMVSPPLVGGIVLTRLIDFDIGWVDCPGPGGTTFRRRHLGYGFTPGYASPDYFLWATERRRPGGPIHFPEYAADIFAAGLVLFELFTGTSMASALRDEPATVVLDHAARRVFKDFLPRVSFSGKAPVDVGVSALIHRMLYVDPQHRPTMAQVKNDLSALQAQWAGRGGTTAHQVQARARANEILVRQTTGFSLNLDSRVAPVFSAMAGRLFFHPAQQQVVLQAFHAHAGLTLQGKPVPVAPDFVAVKDGDVLAYNGVTLTLRIPG